MRVLFRNEGERERDCACVTKCDKVRQSSHPFSTRIYAAWSTSERTS